MAIKFSIKDRELTAFLAGVRALGYEEGLIESLGNESFSIPFSSGLPQYYHADFVLTSVPVDRSRNNIHSWNVTLAGDGRGDLDMPIIYEDAMGKVKEKLEALAA